MKRLFPVALLIAAACASVFGQTNIDRIEYFFDSDPGFGNGTSIAITPGPNQNVNINISTSALTVGFHTLIIRARHQSGSWGVQDSRVVYVASQAVTSDAILSSMEYYIDTDPGPGNGTPVTITGAPASVNLLANIPTGSLAGGFHVLHLRARDVDGNWGVPDSRAFYVIPSNVAAQGTVTQLEYFFDNEPGYGAGTQLTVTAGTQINISQLIASTPLSNGFHTISIRARDNDGVWGFAEVRPFYVDPFTQISSLEYYVDTDPGEGAATPVSITPGGSIDQNFPVATASLTAGTHTLGIRAARTDGSWGNTTTQAFNVNATPVNNTPVLSSQTTTVFYSTDPVAINNSITLTDADGAIVSATVSITTNFQTSEDELLFTAQNGISGSYNSGVMTLSGAASVASYQTALRSVQYNNTATAPNTADRTISFVVNDGLANSNAVTATITINKPPVIEAAGKDTQAGGNIVLQFDDIFSDPDDNLDFTTLSVISKQGAVVTISGEFITVNYVSISEFKGTDQLTITICDTGGQCQTQLVSVEVGAEVDIYNGISANGDTTNDFFKIRFLPIGSRVAIFNRWGDTVYENSDYDINDPSKRFEGIGKNGNELTAGTYYYKIVLPPSDGSREYTGYLHLKR